MAHDSIICGYGDVAARLAKAVGLGERTTGFVIEVFPDSAITVRSEHVTTSGAIEAVSTIFEQASADGTGRPLAAERHAIPPNRLDDLRLRSASGALTNAERLALVVLSGGSRGEEAIGPLLDATMEEYGHGGYRVPVRIVGDRSKLQVVLTPPRGAVSPHSAMRAELRRAVEGWANGESKAIILPAGYTLEAYECENGPKVDIKEESHAA